MQRAVIGFPEWSQEMSFAGADFEADYPVTNLGSYEIARVARSLGLEVDFTVTLEQPRPIRMIGLCGHNMGRGGRYRVELYRDASATQLLHDTGWQNIWPVVYGYQERDFYTPNFWYGQYSTQEIKGQYQTRILWLDKRYYAQAAKVYLSDTNDDGYIDLGYFGLAEGWQLSVNPAYGQQFGFEFNSISTKSAGGSIYTEELSQARLFKGTINYMKMREVKEKAYEMQRQLKTTIPFMWLPNPEDIRNQARDSYLAKLVVDTDLFSVASHQRGSFPLNFREVI